MTARQSCHGCGGHGLVPTYTRGPSSHFDDGLGPCHDAPCETCGGSGFVPCFICGSPATDHTAEGPACAACAPCCLPLDPEAIERGRQERDTRPPTEVRDTERVPGCWAADAAGR